MTDITQELEDLQRKIQEAQAKKARAEIEKENAEKAKASALTALKEEYGVETVEDAEKLRAKMEKALEAALDKAKAALEESA